MLSAQAIRSLILTAIFFVIRSQPKTLEQPMALSFQVRPELPWYIEFSVLSSEIEPLTLTARRKRPPQKVTATEPEIQFARSARVTYGCFRNQLPQNFVENDVIMADLEYFKSQSGQKFKIRFDYVVKDKAEDFVITEGSKMMDAFQVGVNTTNLTSLFADNIFGANARTIFTEDNIGTYRDCPNSDSDCEYQDELLRTAIEHGNVGTRLVLTGQQPPLTNAVDAIRTVIVDKLQLRHLAFSILQAQFRDNELLFELASPRNAIEVLTKARLLLKRSPFKIRIADMDFVDISLLQRTTNE